jgi:hypothetical protein
VPHRRLRHRKVAPAHRIGIAAAETGYRVRYTTAAALVDELVEAADDKTLSRTIARYGRVDLLCLDELGYLELDRRGAELLFQVSPNARNAPASPWRPTPPSPVEWARTFTDPRRDRGPDHLRSQHHRDRHRLIPATRHQTQTHLTPRSTRLRGRGQS